MYAAPFERDPDEGDPPTEYQKTNPLKPTIDNIDAGKRIWTRECAVCHGDAAHGEGIYREGIEPVPPNFDDTATYDSYTDADYFWRISEGVPWTAMPTWKLVYNETERWQLVTYIKTMFTQTATAPPQPTEAEQITTTAVMKKLRLPKSASFDAGRQQFLVTCAHCHGLAGDGNGWYGDYLNPKPANLQQKLASSVPGITTNYDGITFSKVTNGMRDSAMPTWGEFLNTRMRWDDVKYLKDSFTTGIPAAQQPIALRQGRRAAALRSHRHRHLPRRDRLNRAGRRQAHLRAVLRDVPRRDAGKGDGPGAKSAFRRASCAVARRT